MYEDDNDGPKVNSERVVQALKKWSPNGLCAGTLVQKNGDPKQTEACAIGCLALDFVMSKTGARWFKKNRRNQYFFLKKYLYGGSTLSGYSQTVIKFRTAMQEHYGIDTEMESAMMSYNDSCMDNDGMPVGDKESSVPTPIRKTIFSLRKRFDKFNAKRDSETVEGFGDE
jgi:hypothetical protein